MPIVPCVPVAHVIAALLAVPETLAVITSPPSRLVPALGDVRVTAMYGSRPPGSGDASRCAEASLPRRVGARACVARPARRPGIVTRTDPTHPR